jgi:hypothetical protein
VKPKKKYKLRLDLKLDLGFVVLYRIERLSDKVLGGYIEKESNLAQYGNAWVSGNAMVYGNARVFGTAQVFGDARVSGTAWVCGNTKVSSFQHLIHYQIAFKYNVTITPDNIVIGCSLKKRLEWLKVTKKEAIEMGLPAEFYQHYKQLIKTGMRLVPSREKLNRLEGK